MVKKAKEEKVAQKLDVGYGGELNDLEMELVEECDDDFIPYLNLGIERGWHFPDQDGNYIETLYVMGEEETREVEQGRRTLPVGSNLETVFGGLSKRATAIYNGMVTKEWLIITSGEVLTVTDLEDQPGWDRPRRTR